MTELEQIKKELEHYKQKFSVAEQDVAVDGYLAYVNIIRQQVQLIKEFKIKDNIEGKKSENAMYERTEGIWKNLPDMISSMNRLKIELNIEYDENAGKPKITATTAQSLAKTG